MFDLWPSVCLDDGGRLDQHPRAGHHPTGRDHAQGRAHPATGWPEQGAHGGQVNTRLSLAAHMMKLTSDWPGSGRTLNSPLSGRLSRWETLSNFKNLFSALNILFSYAFFNKVYTPVSRSTGPTSMSWTLPSLTPRPTSSVWRRSRGRWRRTWSNCRWYRYIKPNTTPAKPVLKKSRAGVWDCDVTGLCPDWAHCQNSNNSSKKESLFRRLVRNGNWWKRNTEQNLRRNLRSIAKAMKWFTT